MGAVDAALEYDEKDFFPLESSRPRQNLPPRDRAKGKT